MGMSASARARRFLCFVSPFAWLLAHADLLAAQAPRPSALPGNVVQVRAGEFFFQAADTIAAGLTTFELHQTGIIHRRVMTGGAASDSGAVHQGDATHGFHMLWLVRLDSGRTIADFYSGIQTGTSSSTSIGRSLGGPGFALPPRTSNATFTLRPGNYVLVCHVGSLRADRTRYHALKGMFRQLTVVPSAKPEAAAPAVDVVATIAADGQVTFSTPITAGRVRMRVDNAHARGYEFQFRRILPGYTVAEALAWRADAGPTTARPFQPWTGLSDVPAGGSLITTIDFEPGDYFVGAPRLAFSVPRNAKQDRLR